MLSVQSTLPLCFQRPGTSLGAVNTEVKTVPSLRALLRDVGGTGDNSGNKQVKNSKNYPGFHKNREPNPERDPDSAT